jgi:hypothetical protein
MDPQEVKEIKLSFYKVDARQHLNKKELVNGCVRILL